MFTDVDLVAIWLPYLRAKLKETTNRARAWPQIKTNSLMAYLFTQEINLFELCTICYTALLVAGIFSNKNGHEHLWFHCWARQWKPAASYRPEKVKPSSSPICCRFPWGEERCWSWHSLPEPTNKPCLFFQACWLKISMENWGRRKRGRQKERGGKTAPGLEGDIVCMCTQAQGLWPAA